jgi:hypothetical protein
VADPFGNEPTPSRRRMLAPRTDRPKRRPLRYRGVTLGSEKKRPALGVRRQIILEAPLVLAVALLGAAVNVHHEPGRTIAFALGGVFACVFRSCSLGSGNARNPQAPRSPPSSFFSV